MPNIKCTIFFKQLYYCTIILDPKVPKSAQKGVTIMCFHLYDNNIEIFQA